MGKDIVTWWDDVKEIWRTVGNTTTKESQFYPLTPDHPDGSVDIGPLPVLPSDPTNKLFDFYFMTATGPPTTITVQPVIGDYTVQVVDTTFMVVGERVGLFDVEGRYHLAVILSKTATSITINNAVDYEFPVGQTAIGLTSHMNVNGSVTPVDFVIRAGELPDSKLHLDLTSVVIGIKCTSFPELYQFGDIPALLRGLDFTTINNDTGEHRHLFTLRDNFELGMLGDYTTQSDRKATGPAVPYMLIVKIQFSGEGHGVVVRLSQGDEFRCRVQDDLLALDWIEVIAKGHLADEHLYE